MSDSFLKEVLLYLKLEISFLKKPSRRLYVLKIWGVAPKEEDVGLIKAKVLNKMRENKENAFYIESRA